MKGASWEDGLPPSCNTGAENPLQSALNPRIDWLQATFKNEEYVQKPAQFIEEVLLLDPDKFDDLEVGLYGYRRSMRMGNIAVYYDGRADMGIHLQMTGSGCREFEYFGLDWGTFFAIVVEAGGNFTRLDLALDDHYGYWSMRIVEKKVKRGEVVSKFKRATQIKKIDLETGETVGSTVYFGSGSSRIQIRMYDKRKEQMGKKDIDPEKLPEVWNRVEIEARDERAQAIAAMIAQDVPAGVVIRGILKYYVRFVVRGTDKKRCRWKTVRWWKKFLDDVEPLRLVEKGEIDATIEKRVAWVKRQVAPSLAAIIKAMDGEMTVIYDAIKEGMERLKPRDLVMIRQYKETAGDWGTHG